MGITSENCEGATLLSLMILLALMAFLAGQITDRTVLTFTLAQQEKHSLATEEKLYDKLLQPSLSSTFLLEEILQGGKVLTGAVTYTLPTVVPGKTVYKLNEYFQEEESCSEELLTLSEPPTLLPLSPFSPRQRKVCKSPNLTLIDSYRTAHSAVFGTIQQETADVILVVHGYLVVPEMIITGGKMTIIAGGDVWIQKIKTDLLSSTVQILSLNGGITVSEVGEGVILLGDAHTYLNIPMTIDSPISLIAIPKSLGWISGIFIGGELK